MVFSNVLGAERNFAAQLKSDINKLQKEADKDPDSFKSNMVKMEKKWGGRANAVERSVVNAMLASCYHEMIWTSISDFDEETRTDYVNKRNEHCAKALDDMEALASAHASDYYVLMEKGKDSELYEGDILSVIVGFVEKMHPTDETRVCEIYEEASQTYKKRGNLNGYGLMMMNALENRLGLTKAEGGINENQYKTRLYELLQEVKGVEVGADVALEYKSLIDGRDERILFYNSILDSLAPSRCLPNLKNDMNNLLQPTVTIAEREDIYPGRPFTLKVLFWNSEKTTVTIRRFAGWKKDKYGNNTEPLLTGEVVSRTDVVLEMDSTNRERKSKGLPPCGWAEAEASLPAGYYVATAEGVGGTTTEVFKVTTMRMVFAPKDMGHDRVYVVDNMTGRPVAGVKVQGRERQPKNKTNGDYDMDEIVFEQITGADGAVDVTNSKWVRAVRSEDDYSYWKDIHNVFVSKKEEEETEIVAKVFTDRSIYMPGQTVKGSVAIFQQTGDEVMAAEDKKIRLRLFNPKWDEIGNITVKTNAFGTGTFEFSLPEECEVGRWSIRVGDGASGETHTTHEIRVEEYKRPTFEVSFDSHQGGQLGDSIGVRGKAEMFAGVPVQGAKVSYRVECGSASMFARFYNTHWNRVSEGELTTDEWGEFVVPVVLAEPSANDTDPDTDDEDFAPTAIAFRIVASVTDQRGETQEATWLFSCSHHEFALFAEVKQMVNMAEAPSFKVSAWNAAHEETEVKGTYTLMQGETAVAMGEFVSGCDIPLPNDLQLGGKYRIEVSAIDSKGREETAHASLYTYSSNLETTDFDKLGCDAKTRSKDIRIDNDILYAEKKTYTRNGSVDLYFATKEEDAYIIYNVYNAKGLMEQHQAVTDGTMKRLRLQYRKEWGEGIYVSMFYVHNGVFSHQQLKFELEEPEKQLKMEWATFRDKLQPGQEETWALTVSDKDGKPVGDAELMAVLYDSSLDRIYGHSWNFALSFKRYTPYMRVYAPVLTKQPLLRLIAKTKNGKTYDRDFNSLIGFEHDRWIRGRHRFYKMASPVGAASRRHDHFDGTEVFNDAPLLLDREETAATGTEAEQDFDNVTIREDFAETAFFMPHLLSDTKGNVQIQFRLPESITEWKFMGFAHTKDADHATMTAKVVARKAFMVKPNVPRFVRWHDRAVVSSSIINQGEEALQGKARIRLIDHRTEEVVWTEETNFTAEANKTVGVDFDFTVSEEWKDLDCEIVAIAAGTSDGEKCRLPVLTTKKECTQTIPFYIIAPSDTLQGEASKSINLTDLFNKNSATATNRGMKVEYTDNPAWMCIEALRSVKNPDFDDAVDYAVSLYANTCILDLMQTFPILNQHENEDSLKQRIEEAKKKLAELHNVDDGWSWFKGMKSSYYITMVVCEKLALLPHPTDDVKMMLASGMAYLDKHELAAYKLRLKEDGKMRYVGESELRYLYLSSLMADRQVSKEVEKMRKDYLALVEKAPKDYTIYGVANAANAMSAFGRTKAANRFVQFLKDYTVEKPGQGRFFATDAAYYSWADYRIPTQVAAMKAIYNHDKNDPYLNYMQLWIISQKQVQKWDNPMNTIDVADLLMAISPLQTFHESQMPELTIDGEAITGMDYGTMNTERDKFEGRESNLVLQGNVLADVPTPMIAKGAKTLTVEKHTPGISWGAAYATFLEDTGSLERYATEELKVDRKLYVQKAGSAEWTAVGKDTTLKVGDKLRIRHIITADRDMDFVRLTAQQPACLEPIRQLSGYQWMGGRGGYMSVRNAGFDIFFDWFTRGTSTVDMDYHISRPGIYEMGISTIECAYAKQFGGHTAGQKLKVTEK